MEKRKEKHEEQVKRGRGPFHYGWESRKGWKMRMNPKYMVYDRRRN